MCGVPVKYVVIDIALEFEGMMEDGAKVGVVGCCIIREGSSIL